MVQISVWSGRLMTSCWCGNLQTVVSNVIKESLSQENIFSLNNHFVRIRLVGYKGTTCRWPKMTLSTKKFLYNET